jgi:uncharacterized iron-regulated membrane protein
MFFKLKTWYSIHKWMSIFTGLIIVMWLVTGLVMTAPDLLPLESPLHAQELLPPDFRRVEMSPAEAAAVLAQTLGRTPPVAAVGFQQLGNTLAYQIRLNTGQSHLVDVATGQVIAITPELAGQLAALAYPGLGPPAAVIQLDRHDTGWPEGDLPVVRLIYADPAQTTVHVSTQSGQVSHTDRTGRIVDLFGALHTFEFVELYLPGRAQVVAGLVWASSLLTGLAALVGYYLALPRRWQTSRARR